MFDAIAYINTPRWQTVSLGLDRTRELLDGLARPQDRLRFVHVAGTNGKGSTCAIIASVLQQAGYRVGLFTSPALYRFEDRIRVNGVCISPQELQAVTERVKTVADSMKDHPTEFELLTAVAFSHFADKGCDIVVVEVGLGGRLDSTNVIDAAEVSIITPISFDHRSLLGDTLAAIAAEKAGIIKPGTPVVSAPQEPSVLAVLETRVREAQTTLSLVDLSLLKRTSDMLQEECVRGETRGSTEAAANAATEGSLALLSYKNRHDLKLGLAGSFQLVNAATALDAIDALIARGWRISEEAIREGLANVRWPGRFELVCAEPAIVFDGAHNIAGMEAFTATLDELYPNSYRIALTGVLADKDHFDMARMLVSGVDALVPVTPENDRALESSAYAEELRSIDVPSSRASLIEAAPSIEAGVQRALQLYQDALADQRQAHPLICVCGSLYLLGSVMEVLRQAGLAL